MKHLKTFEMLKYKTERVIQVQDWDRLVEETYGRPYRFQQQDGCKGRGVEHITIPSKYAKEEDEEMNDSIPEEINGEEMGVKFAVWLAGDPKKPVGGKEEYLIRMFWERNFYPNIDVVANDLYEKGLIEAGSYTINIDW
jgi:hypothetical protein